ncbi:response regulator [Candidatus Woesearchaeota archaeon]|nr:response regulator [Candidatus Woesearchaeota archaeon]
MKAYEKPSITKIESIEQLVKQMPTIKDYLARRDFEVARAVCSLLGHEINNPLTSVLGYSDLLIQSEDIPERIERNLSVIAENAHRVGRVIHDMMRMKRVAIGEDGMLDLEWSTKEYGEPRTAIIVDDDCNHRNAVENVLDVAGFKVRSFGSPDDAYQNFTSVPSSVLVTDLDLKASRTGLDLVRDIHSACRDRNYLMPSVIVASGSLKDKAPENGRCYHDVLLALAASYKFFYFPAEKPISLKWLRKGLNLAEKYQDEKRNRTRVSTYRP